MEITSGPEPRDERFQGVARRAEAMTTPDADPPRDADSLESLFGGAEVSGDDASAAGTLAAAFSADPPREVAGSPSARHGNSGEELSLQHLFGEVDERSSGAVTLDAFFSGSRNAEQMAADGSAPAGAERADIEQFTAWLEGLKKK